MLACETGHVEFRAVLLVNQTTKRGRHFQPALSVDTCRVISPEHKRSTNQKICGWPFRKSVLSSRRTSLDHFRPLLTTSQERRLALPTCAVKVKRWRRPTFSAALWTVSVRPLSTGDRVAVMISCQ